MACIIFPANANKSLWGGRWWWWVGGWEWVAVVVVGGLWWRVSVVAPWCLLLLEN